MSESRTYNAKRNIIFGLINRIIQLCLPFVIRTILIKNLGADYLGLDSLFVSILEVLNMAELGFSSAIIFSLYKPLAEKDNETVCALLQLYKQIYRIIGFLIIVIGLLLMPFLPRLLKGTWPDNINIYLLYSIYLFTTAISYLVFAYQNALLSASQRRDIISNVESILSIIKCTVQFVCLLVFHNFYAYVIWKLIYAVFYNVIINAITKKNFPQYVCRGKINKEEKKAIIQQIGGLAISKLCLTTRNSFDNIVLALFCGLTDVAIYSNYYYIFGAVASITGVINLAISAGVGNSIATESTEKNYEDLKKFHYYFSWISAWCSICMLCLYQPFMELWVGKELTAPYIIAVFFSLYFYIGQMGQMRSVYSGGYGIWWEFRFSNIIEVICNLILNFILGFFFGMKGIVFATILTVLIFGVIISDIITLKTCFNKKSGEFLLITFIYFVFTSLCAIIVYLICSTFSYSNLLLTFAIRFGICLIVPNIYFFIMSCLNKKHRNYLSFMKDNYLCRRK